MSSPTGGIYDGVLVICSRERYGVVQTLMSQDMAGFPLPGPERLYELVALNLSIE